MPVLKNAKTVWVGDTPYNIPGTEITIYQIKLEIDGERELHSTMSKALAGLGWEGDVEVYTNAKGKDYVRQAPKEDTGGNSATQKPVDKPFYRDSTTIPLDVWRVLINVQGVPENPAQFASFFDTVQEHANELLLLIDNVRNGVTKETVDKVWPVDGIDDLGAGNMIGQPDD